MVKVWINLGKCQIADCDKDAVWFTIENGAVKDQMCSDHFNEIANETGENF